MKFKHKKVLFTITPFMLYLLLQQNVMFDIDKISIRNRNFELWNGSTPNNWKQVNDVVGNNLDTVKLESETTRVKSGKAVKVISSNPCCGIEQPIISPVSKLKIPVYVTQGQACVHLAKTDGTSPYLNRSKLSNYGFTASMGYVGARLNNGDWGEFFTLTNSGERSSEGSIYITRNGTNKKLVCSEPSVKQLMSTILQYPTKEYIIYNHINSRGDCSPYIMKSTDSFNTVISNVPLATGTDVQVYGALVHPSGKTIIPYVYQTDGHYILDVIVSDDNMETWHKLNQPKTIVNARGLMEPKPIILPNGNVAIICRTTEGHLARVNLNMSNMTLERPYFTNIATSSTAFSLKTLKDGSHVMAWNAVKIQKGNYPRRMLCLGFYDANLTTINNIHIISTNKTDNGSMNGDIPYIHSPILSLDGDNIYVYYENVASSTNITSTKCSGKINNLKSNNKTVSNSLNKWETLELNLLKGLFKVQILSGISSDSTFIIDNIETLDNFRIES